MFTNAVTNFFSSIIQLLLTEKLKTSHPSYRHSTTQYVQTLLWIQNH